ncbi:flagellar hook-associated protein 2 [Lysinibacillus composti]|uniref:Flagellar hook-associated protein 2 n=1 Tax=Lysinibacillus composti TaxID=720633 RepID=A0A3N9UU48_9BACI|nr:flagellar filament capping protein FliD [Lysinibacillus composti]MBM7607964.1 flagellar hook-associated protein 2 [Lysinibacillus composti]RQW75426.1 flagellar hook protein [Lysinibacillus composti]
MSTMRIGGLASGMDIDSLVEKLMIAERAPLDKLEQKKQTYEWQRDAYRDVNKKLQTFDTYIADNLILKSLNTKTATVSNTDYLTATATSAASGSLTIEGVSQLATAARAVGNQVNAVGSTKMKYLATGSIELKVIQSNGEMATTATKIEITDDMTVNQFVSKVNSSNAGVNLVFENGKFSMTAKFTGDNKDGNEIEVVSGEDVFEKLGFVFKEVGTVENPKKSIQTTDGKNAIFQVNGIATERSTNDFTISGYSITLKGKFNTIQTIAEKYESAVKELELAQFDLNGEDNENSKTTKLNKAILDYYGSAIPIEDTKSNYTSIHDKTYTDAFGNTISLSKQETFSKLGSTFWKELSDSEVNFIKETLVNLTDKSATKIREAITDSSLDNDTSKQKLNALTDEQLQAIAKLNEDPDIDDITSFIEQANYESATKEEKSATYSEKVKADELKSKYSALGDEFLNGLIVDENVNEISKILAIDFTQENAIANITDTTLKAKLENLNENQIKVLDNLTSENLTNFKALASQNVLRKVYINAEAEYKAAEIRLENAINTENTAKSDVIEAGIPLNPDGTIDNESDVIKNAIKISAVTMTSTTNVDEMITKIKDFVTTYNGLITDLTNLTNETKYRDYKPLTTLQRKEMEEKEIELWEEKAKSGLLRGDSIIKNGLSSMRSLIYQSNPAVSNSKFNTLYSIGITTSKDYLSGGTLEIDEKKLRAALEEDPDAVTTLLRNSDGKEKDTVTVNGVTKEADTRGFLQKLRGSMTSIKLRIEDRAGRSTMTEAQYTLGKNLKSVNDGIETWEDKLTAIEDRYWRQFTAMETAINKANSQSTSLMSYFSY